MKWFVILSLIVNIIYFLCGSILLGSALESSDKDVGRTAFKILGLSMIWIILASFALIFGG